MNKVIIIIAIFTLASLSIFTSNTVNAQSMPQPPAPEFTIRYLKASYNITASTNNGTTITQQIDNSTVELVLKNQPYNYSVENITYLLYYNVQTKSRFTQDWTELYPLVSQMGNWKGSYSWYIWVAKTKIYLPQYRCLPASNSSFTILSFPAKNYSINTDFQVKVLIGHNSSYLIPPYTPWNPEGILSIKYGRKLNAIAYDTSSDWNTTQTVRLPEPSSTPTLAIPTTKGVQNEDFLNSNLFLILTLLLAVILVSVFLIRGKIKTRLFNK